MQRVRVFGHVEDDGVIAENFQWCGRNPVFFDKSVNIETLANDGGNPYNFSLRQSIIYKGRATTENGYFQFDFVVPKDISYQEGAGKIHLYALSDDTDAQGSRGGFQVGGTDTSAPTDEQGPTIELFLGF